MHHGRAHEVAVTIEPGTPLAPAARHLSVGYQPLAFGHCHARTQFASKVRISRTGFGDEADHIAATKEAAACAVQSPSGKVRR